MEGMCDAYFQDFGSDMNMYAQVTSATPCRLISSKVRIISLVQVQNLSFFFFNIQPHFEPTRRNMYKNSTKHLTNQKKFRQIFLSRQNIFF